MTAHCKRFAALILVAGGLCLGRSFDVISTNTGGVEVVMVPIHHGSLMLQFRGQAIYVDPDNKGDYTGLPKADFIFFTAGSTGDDSQIRKNSTVVVNAPPAEKKSFGEISVESAGKGLIFAMAGRRFYVSGEAPATPVDNIDVAFVCMSHACAPNPSQAIKVTGARIIFPYRTNGANLQGLKSTPQKEIRLRGWS